MAKVKLSYKARTWLLVVCAVACGAFLAREPFQVYQQQRAKAAQAELDAQRDMKQVSSLKQEKEDLSSPTGKERLARERGYRKPGETLLETKDSGQ